MLRALVLIAGLGLVPKPAFVPPQPVSFAAADGTQIFATAYDVASPTAPVILLFHQAGSSKSEYVPIAPRLTQLGYGALAVDLRSGGDLYEPPNETVQHRGKSATDYRDALPDMDAALAFVKRTHPRAPVYAWGSSYSAALVFAFAARHPHDVRALLAFSPGEYLPHDGRYVRDAARHVRCPVFVDSAADAKEERDARAIFDAVPGGDKIDFVPRAGVHGASTLRDDRDPDGAAENWDAVTRFLAHVRAMQRS